MMKIDVVIPNYNGSDLIRKNVPALLTAMNKYDFGKLVIVDDFSENEDYERVSEFVKSLDSKKVVLLKNSRNLGFSSTVNRGVAECSSDLVLILNSDVLVHSNFLDETLSDIESNENIFGVGLADKSIDSRGTVIRGRGLAIFKRGFLVHRRGEPDTKDTFWISGGSSLIRADLFKKVGGFDSLYNPFYWEDIDLSYRARKAGYQIMFEPQSTVEHRHEEGAIKKTYSASEVKAVAYKNQIIFVWKNMSGKFLFTNIIWLPYYIVKSLINFDTPFFKGLLLAMIKLPQIIKKRSSQKRYYSISDSDIIV